MRSGSFLVPVAGAAPKALRSLVGPARRLATSADPTEVTGRITGHELVGSHRGNDNGARRDHGELAQLGPAHDRGVRAYRRPSPDDGRDGLPVAEGPGDTVVGENCARSDEDVVLERDAGVEGDIVLPLPSSTAPPPRVDVDVLAEPCLGTDASAGADLCVMPHLGAAADKSTVLHDGGLVHEERVKRHPASPDHGTPNGRTPGSS